MSASPRILIVDDDQDAAEWLKFRLETSFPEVQVEIRLNPDVSGCYDIFLIDNDFDGTCLAPDLTQAIRSDRPQALIITFSSFLDRDTLKKLVNLGCDGACDKSDPQDVQRMTKIIETHLHRRAGGRLGNRDWTAEQFARASV